MLSANDAGSVAFNVPAGHSSQAVPQLLKWMEESAVHHSAEEHPLGALLLYRRAFCYVLVVAHFICFGSCASAATVQCGVADMISRVSVREWGLSHSTLEEVFLEVSRRHNFKYEEEEWGGDADPTSKSGKQEEHSDHSESAETDSLLGKKSRDKEPQALNSHPWRALLRKNFALQKVRDC